MKHLIIVLALGVAAALSTLAYATTHKEGPAMKEGSPCEAQATEKKLAGAAKTSFLKKCMADEKPAASADCEKSAADKKLAGAAKTSHMKKCMADAKT